MNNLVSSVISNKSLILIVVSAISLFFYFDFAYAQDTTTQKVPDWIKTTLKWYVEGTVSEQEFLNAIKFLVENNIIKLETGASVSPPQVAEPTATQTPVSKPRVNTCQILYPTYKTMNPLAFKAKYSHINYLNECLELYRDPLWNYQGADRLDRLYNRFLELSEKTKQERPKLSTEPSITIISAINIGIEKFLVKFNVCAGDLTVDKAKILINSKIESIVIGSTKDIPANACRTYETQINAKNTANIKASILEHFLIE